MKRIFALIIFALTISSLSAQHFGIKGGLNLAKIKVSSNGMSVSAANLSSFHAGAVYETPVYNNFYFNTGLLFSQKGYEVDYMHNNITIRINYIQAPFNFAYKYQTGNIKLFIQAGPFLAFAISGKSSGTELDYMGNIVNVEDFKFGNNETDYKRFDAGLGLEAGIEFSKFRLGIGYDLGQIDIMNDPNSNSVTRNFEISAYYFFK